MLVYEFFFIKDLIKLYEMPEKKEDAYKFKILK